MSDAVLYVGARSPESIRITIDRGPDDDFDLTTVVDLSEVIAYAPDGTDAGWTFSKVSATATSIIIQRVFAADGSDVQTHGDYIVAGWLLSVDQRRRMTPVYVTAHRYP